MDENLVGYLLNSLDPETHRQVEDHLREDPRARHQLEQLRRALEPLAYVEPPEAPAGLWVRTLAHIAEDRCRPLPAAPRPMTVPAGTPSRAWWKRADLLVAASVMLLLAGISVPWLLHLRHEKQILACANNLRQFHQALVNYSHVNDGSFPEVKDQGPQSVAGAFVPVLNDAKLLDKDISVACPGNVNREATVRSMKELEALHRDDREKFRQVTQDLSGCYAYSLGYQKVDADGVLRHHGLRRNSGDKIPIMSDRPPFAVDDFSGLDTTNSKNHGGKGQNVLHIDGSVKFLPQRTIGQDDIYLNHQRQVGAGGGPEDTVLGASWARPYPHDAD